MTRVRADTLTLSYLAGIYLSRYTALSIKAVSRAWYQNERFFMIKKYEPMQRIHVFLFLIIAFFVGIAQHYTQLAKAFYASDDHIYSYLIGVGLAKPQAVQDAQQYFGDHLNDSNSTEEFRYRVEIRKKYGRNYVFHSGFQYLAGYYINKAFGITVANYPVYLAYTMVSGAVYAYMLALLMLVGGVRLMKISTRTAAAFCFALITIALLDGLPFRERLDDIMLHASIWESIQHSLILLLQPGSQYNLMSFTERANFFLMAFLVFIARSEQRYALAYGLMVLLCLFHQSLAGLLLLIFVLLDAVLRSAVLKQPRVYIPIVIAALAFGLRESLWSTIGNAGLGVVGISLAMALLIFLAASLSTRVKSALCRVRRCFVTARDRYVMRVGIYADAGLLIVGWVLTWPIAFAIVKALDNFKTYYFWAGVHGRTLACITPYLLFCLFYFLYGVLQKRTRMPMQRIPQTILVLAMLGAAPIIVKAVVRYNGEHVVQRMVPTLTEVDTFLRTKKISFVNSQYDERIIYYGIAKSVDTGTDLYQHMLLEKSSTVQ